MVFHSTALNSLHDAVGAGLAAQGRPPRSHVFWTGKQAWHTEASAFRVGEYSLGLSGGGALLTLVRRVLPTTLRFQFLQCVPAMSSAYVLDGVVCWFLP